jgi:hypothetical protein
MTPNGMDGADRHGFLTSCQPCLGDNALSNPAFQGDVMQTKPQHSLIEAEQLQRRKVGND